MKCDGKVILETSRLLIRELMPTDETGMFTLDSNPRVHSHLGNNPIQTIDQIRELSKDMEPFVIFMNSLKKNG